MCFWLTNCNLNQSVGNMSCSMFVTLVTVFQEFKCDSLLVSVIRNNEINIILNKIAFLKDDRVNLSD